MALVKEEVKRPYRSVRRAQRAAATRAAIRKAAASLFVEQGFAATTMRQVAAHAEVGERTLYDAFASKVDLFHHVAGVAIVGDEAPVPAAERPEFRSALRERNGPDAVALFSKYVAALLERAGALIMVAVESAGADPAMRRFSDEGAAATKANTAAFVASLADHGVLAGDVDEAAAVAFTLASPHVHQLLRVHSAWTAEAYRDWLENALVKLLLTSAQDADASFE